MKLLIHIDGGSRGNPGPAAAGVTIRKADDPQPLHEAGYFLGKFTNNVAEYQGLLRALALAKRYEATELVLHSDSELMVRQLNGHYKVKSPQLQPLFEQARHALQGFGRWQLRHVMREQNRRADEMVNLALDAGRDVVVVEEGVSQGRPSAAAPAAGGNDGPQFEIEVRERPGADCPAPCPAGQTYRFGPETPGMCLHAAAAVFAAIDLGARRIRPQTRCERCGVEILVGRAISPK